MKFKFYGNSPIQISRLEHLSWTGSSKLFNVGINVEEKIIECCHPFLLIPAEIFLLFQIYMYI